MGKLTRHKQSLFKIAALALSCSTLAIAQDYTSLKLGEVTWRYELDEDATQYFKLLIDRTTTKQDLLVQVFADGPNQGDPDVYISKSNKKPNRQQNSKWSCFSSGKDTCTIDSKDVNANDTFYIGVRCGETYEGKCSFMIKASLTGEIELEDGVEQELDFAPNEAKVFKFHVPQQSVRSKDDAYRIKSVLITAIPLLPMDEKMSLYASTKGEINPKKQQKKGTPGWRKGQTLRLTEEDVDNWCTDCFVTIMLDVSTAGKYQIMARSNVGINQLQDGEKYDDVAFFGEKQCYKYFVKDRATDVEVRVAQYSGLVSFSFNPKSIPESYDAGAFGMAEFGNSALLVTSQDRKDAGSAEGLYYLCVFSHMTSTFSVLVRETTANVTYHFLEDSWDEGGEVSGTSSQIYVYEAPQLDYKGELLSFEFILTSLSGEIPKLYGAFCQSSDPDSCGAIDQDSFLKTAKQAKAAGKGLSLRLDHDAQLCQKKYNGECYYTILVVGQGKSDGDLSRYAIASVHSQQNYQLLHEGAVVQDFVDLGTYKYFSFTLPPVAATSKELKPRNVTFTLNSLHGDADLFVSRVHKFPNRMDFEKNSVKSGDSYDIVYFDDKTGTGDLSGTYYIAAYSYQYSTFSLQVQVDRTAPSLDGKTNVLARKAPVLVEGVPMRGSLGNADSNLYRVEVKQVEGFEKPIKIAISPLSGGVTVLASVGFEPTTTKYIWSTKENLLVIDPKDPQFKREATYYILVAPKINFFDIFNPTKHISYLATYFTQDSSQYLKASQPLEVKQSVGEQAYFRHFVSSFSKDMSISMTVFSGTPNIFASFSPAQRHPNETTPETFNTLFQSNSTKGSKSKSLFFPQQLFHVQNPSCKSSLAESTDACVLYATVVCSGSANDTCRYTLTVNYESSGLQQLIIGQPQHNVLKDGTYHYYYMTIKESSILEGQQIVAVLSSVKGNADLYVKFIDTPQRSNPNEWDTPNTKEYLYKSVMTADNQDIVKIDAKKDQNLKDCFSRFKSEYGSEAECGIVYGVYSPNQGGPNATVTTYNLVVFMDIMQLMNQAPINGEVDQGSFQYYLYESTCADCTILVSLSTTGSGNPDLYINFGDEALPSRDKSDITSSTLMSEVVSISLKHPFFKKRNINSMKGPVLIGVYGVKKSNYTLVISQDKHPMSLLEENKPKRASQDPFEIVYYSWYNLNLNESNAKDFRVSLNVLNGQADIYMSTFYEYDYANGKESGFSQNMLARLPKSKRDAQWVLENVDSRTSVRNREILVVNQERSYCTMCFYLIGVVTHDMKTDYTLQISVIDQADFQNAQILKLGEKYHTTFNFNRGDTKRVYRFILDDKSPMVIYQETKNSEATAVLSLSQNGDNPILTLTNTEAKALKADDPNLHADRMYYLIITETQGSEISDHMIQVLQQRTILRLADGVPQQFLFHSKEDISKLMIFTIPDGSYTFSIQVKSLTENFYPKLYIKYYEDLETRYKNLEFPPGGEPGYFICKNWDYKLGVMTYQERFENIAGGKAGLALNLLESAEVDQEGIVFVTVTASPVLKMLQGTTYFGTLDHSTSFKIYHVDESIVTRGGTLMLELTPCSGDIDYRLIENPNLPNQQIQDKLGESFIREGRITQYIKLPRKVLYILVKQKQFVGSGAPSDQNADFMIKVRHNSEKMKRNNDYVLPEEGKLTFSINRGFSGGIDLSWGPLIAESQNGRRIPDSRISYMIVATKDSNARLDTQCALSKEMAYRHVMANFDAKGETKYNFKVPQEDQRYYVNVIAKVLPEDELETDLVPYKPMEIFIPSRKSVLSDLALSKIILQLL